MPAQPAKFLPVMLAADRQPAQQGRRNLGVFWKLFGDFGRKLGQPDTTGRNDDDASLIQHYKRRGHFPSEVLAGLKVEVGLKIGIST